MQDNCLLALKYHQKDLFLQHKIQKIFMKYTFSFTSFIFLLLFLSSCADKSGSPPVFVEPVADTAAMEAMKGIWIDTETQSVAFRIKADSIYYPDSTNRPVRFAIFEDTLVVYTGDSVRYPILSRTEYSFEYESLNGESVRLHLSDDPEDSLYFKPHSYAPMLMNEKVHRDTVVFTPSGSRYHLYINVNPTRYRVHYTTYSDEGLAIDNVYFDNIIHIGVYEGRRCIFARDFAKYDFKDMIPSQFLENAILSNMDFSSPDAAGCHFHATLCHPDGASCYVVSITVDYAGHHSLELLEY